MLGVTRGKEARARAIQLPAWNEALGLPRAWDQQWSLRAQQILAFETDLLEHGDILEGSTVVDALTDRIATEAWEELHRVLEMGGSVEALAYMKERLVGKLTERVRAIESGERAVVGVNRYTQGEPSPLVEGVEGFEAVERIEQAHEAEQVERLAAWRGERDGSTVVRVLDHLRRAAETPAADLTPVSIEAARAGVTTGEWADALREVFGEYRPPTGVTGRPMAGEGVGTTLGEARAAVRAAAERLGVRRVRMLVGKPGL